MSHGESQMETQPQPVTANKEKPCKTQVKDDSKVFKFQRLKVTVRKNNMICGEKKIMNPLSTYGDCNMLKGVHYNG